MRIVSRFLPAWSLIAVALSATGPGLAEVAGAGFPADFFVGVYERVGRDDTGAPVNDLVRIDTLGEGFRMSTCAASGPSGPIIDLEFGRVFESENFLVGPPGQPALQCQFHVDPNNYAILNCSNTSGTLYTLWAVEDVSRCDPSE